MQSGSVIGLDRLLATLSKAAKRLATTESQRLIVSIDPQGSLNWQEPDLKVDKHMAKPKKYISLSDVRVSYDYKTDAVVVTSGDTQLKPYGGLKLNVVHGSQTDLGLRALLTEQGAMARNAWVEVSSQSLAEMVFSSKDPDQILLGTDSSGEQVFWNTKKFSTLECFREEGHNGEDLDSMVFAHCIAQKIDFYAIGYDYETTQEYLQYPGVTKGAAPSLIEVHEALASIAAIAEERVQQMTALRISDFREYPVGLERTQMLVAVSNLSEILYHRSSIHNEDRAMAHSCLALLKTISKLGKTVGISLLVSSEGLATKQSVADYGKATYVIAGRRSKEQLPEELQAVYNCKKSYAPGRANVLVPGEAALQVQLGSVEAKEFFELWPSRYHLELRLQGLDVQG